MRDVLLTKLIGHNTSITGSRGSHIPFTIGLGPNEVILLKRFYISVGFSSSSDLAPILEWQIHQKDLPRNIDATGVVSPRPSNGPFVDHDVISSGILSYAIDAGAGASNGLQSERVWEPPVVLVRSPTLVLTIGSTGLSVQLTAELHYMKKVLGKADMLRYMKQFIGTTRASVPRVIDE